MDGVIWIYGKQDIDATVNVSKKHFLAVFTGNDVHNMPHMVLNFDILTYIQHVHKSRYRHCFYFKKILVLGLYFQLQKCCNQRNDQFYGIV